MLATTQQQPDLIDLIIRIVIILTFVVFAAAVIGYKIASQRERKRKERE